MLGLVGFSLIEVKPFHDGEGFFNLDGVVSSPTTEMTKEPDYLGKFVLLESEMDSPVCLEFVLHTSTPFFCGFQSVASYRVYWSNWTSQTAQPSCSATFLR